MYLTQGLHRALQQQPERIATIYRERRQTYRRFTARVARLAAALRAHGMQTGDRVAMLAQNSDRYLEYMMAALWGGGVLNPVNTRWSVAEMVYSFDDCDTGILIVDDAFAAMVGEIQRTARRELLVIHAGDGATPDGMLAYEALIEAAQPMDDSGRGGSDLAAVMYTGGTTGQPKGVMLSHLGMWASSMQRQLECPALPDSVVLHTAPLFHATGLARALSQFFSGDTNLLVPAFNAGEVLECIERERVTETVVVPTMLSALLAHPDFERRDLSSFRRLTYGAAPISNELLDLAMRKLPGIGFMQAYGLTEASPVVACSKPEHHLPAAIAKGLNRSVGRPCSGVSVKIIDENGHEVPRGTVGEIAVRGANVMLGYWNKPEETARALRDGWLHTGDGAYMNDDGFIFIVDRLKDMIVSGGENVYSAEVENALASHPAVAMCAVIGIPDAHWGEAVHAVVVAQAGAAVSADELRTHCRQFIAGYKCPKSIEFRASMPLSAAGKILKRDLRQPFWQDSARAV